MESKEKHLSTQDIAGAPKKPDTTNMKKAETDPGGSHEKSGNPMADSAHAERVEPGVKRAEPGTQQGKDLVPLFSNEAVHGFRSRWTTLQTGFVDEPRRAVEEADELVAQVIKDLAETFSDERSKLERQWDQGDKVSTEDLRLVLQRYRSFFDRFLSV
jgi:hypothetical protein